VRRDHGAPVFTSSNLCLLPNPRIRAAEVVPLYCWAWRVPGSSPPAQLARAAILPATQASVTAHLSANPKRCLRILRTSALGDITDVTSKIERSPVVRLGRRFPKVPISIVVRAQSQPRWISRSEPYSCKLVCYVGRSAIGGGASAPRARSLFA